MRPIWKGAIGFGMVTIPVKLYTATSPKDIRSAARGCRAILNTLGAPVASA